MNDMKYSFFQNHGNHHFEVQFEEQIAFIEYEEHAGVVSLTYTYIPDKLIGTGIFKILAEETLRLIAFQYNKLIPLDLLVKNYLNHHHEYDRLIDPARQSY
jgi:predicted GNAT family acetyltransferase